MENDYQYESQYRLPQRIIFKIRRFLYKTISKKVYIAILVLFLVAGGSFAYVLLTNKNIPVSSNNILGDSVSSLLGGGGEMSDEQVIEKVTKLTTVPEGETPEVATIADVNQLNNQVFFQNAQNGDKVLVYKGAKRVILYRPEINKIIETGHQIEPTPMPSEAPIIIEGEGEEDELLPSISPTNTPTLSP